MRVSLSLLLLILIFVPNSLFAIEEELPEWSEENLRAGWIAGEMLLNFDDVGDLDGFEPLPPLKVDPLTGLTIDDGLDRRKEVELPEYLIRQYFSKQAPGFLTDPQNLLSKDGDASVVNALQRHSEDSDIDLFVYVFKNNQRVPNHVRESEIIEKLYSEDRAAIVVFYYYGLPQRTEFYLNPILTGAVSLPEQRRALQSSVIRSLAWKDASKQLEAFVDQLSIRAYWMERLIAEGNATPEQVHELVIIHEEDTSEADREAEAALKQKVIRYSIIAVIWILILFSVIALLMSGLRKRLLYSAPEALSAPRLGGSRGAGVGPAISFSQNAPPPAEQRDRARGSSENI